MGWDESAKSERLLVTTLWRQWNIRWTYVRHIVQPSACLEALIDISHLWQRLSGRWVWLADELLGVAMRYPASLTAASTANLAVKHCLGGDG